jgi:ubiquitin C-terminal hydrolase
MATVGTRLIRPNNYGTLTNVGNSCYLNTALQMLYRIHTFRIMLENINLDDPQLIQIERENEDAPNGRIILSILKRIFNIFSRGEHNINLKTERVYEQLVENSGLTCGIQQDMTEFIANIINSILTFYDNPHVKNFIDSISFNHIESKICENGKNIIRNPVVIFSNDKERIHQLPKTLDLPIIDRATNIQQLITIFQEAEIMHPPDNMLDSCIITNGNNNRKVISKQNIIRELPSSDYCLISLKRRLPLDYTGRNFYKKTNRIEANTTIIIDNNTYQIIGCGLHIGGASGGHYVYIDYDNNGLPDFTYNDSVIYKVLPTEAEQINTDAYMFLYKKISGVAAPLAPIAPQSLFVPLAPVLSQLTNLQKLKEKIQQINDTTQELKSNPYSHKIKIDLNSFIQTAIILYNQLSDTEKRNISPFIPIEIIQYLEIQIPDNLIDTDKLDATPAKIQNSIVVSQSHNLQRIREKIEQINRKLKQVKDNPNSISDIVGLNGFVDMAIKIYNSLNQDEKTIIGPFIPNDAIRYLDEPLKTTIPREILLNTNREQPMPVAVEKPLHAVPAAVNLKESPEKIYVQIMRLFESIKTNKLKDVREIQERLLFSKFNDFLTYFNKLNIYEKEAFSYLPLDNDLFEYLRQKNQIPIDFPEILNPTVSIVKLRVPILSERLIKGNATKINFFRSDEKFEILPAETIIINLDLENPLRRRTSLDKIEIYKLANGKYVIQQISEVSCAISSIAMLYTDNGLSIEDPRFFKLLRNSLAGTLGHSGTSCERIDQIISSLQLYIPGKYLLHDFFNSYNFEYDIKYFQELIKLYGSLFVNVNFNNPGYGGHAAILDSIDMNHAIIREPYHGYAFKISTRLFIEKKIGKENGEYHFTYLSNQKHSVALTDKEEEARLAKFSRQKYLKYKTKYLQLKNKLIH